MKNALIFMTIFILAAVGWLVLETLSIFDSLLDWMESAAMHWVSNPSGHSLSAPPPPDICQTEGKSRKARESDGQHSSIYGTHDLESKVS